VTIVGSARDAESDVGTELGDEPRAPPRPSSLTAYAYVRERMRGNDPRLITTWAAFVPAGPDVVDEEDEDPVEREPYSDFVGSRTATPVDSLR
jgi:hypothetical protein